MKPSTTGRWCASAEQFPDEVSIRTFHSMPCSDADMKSPLQHVDEYQLWDNFIDHLTPDSVSLKPDFTSP
jgi:hypothetical protein